MNVNNTTAVKNIVKYGSIVYLDNKISITCDWCGSWYCDERYYTSDKRYYTSDKRYCTRINQYQEKY